MAETQQTRAECLQEKIQNFGKYIRELWPNNQLLQEGSNPSEWDLDTSIRWILTYIAPYKAQIYKFDRYALLTVFEPLLTQQDVADLPTNDFRKLCLYLQCFLELTSPEE